jgi:signal transduction histidine kinase
LDAYAQALLEDSGAELSATGRDYAQKIARSAQRMDHLTQDLLTYTRVSREGVMLERIDLTALIRDVMQTYPSLLPWSAAIELRGAFPAVLGHAPSLMQCFSNLLDNAIKFAAPDRPPRIEVSAELRGDTVRVNVSDNGVGIAPEHHERIFGIFERVSHRANGTGIGLAIVRRAVERMGGRVGVESTPGNGATFWLELPHAPAPALPAANADPAPTPAALGQLFWGAPESSHDY